MTKYFGHDIINPFKSHTPRGFYDPVKGHTGIDVNCPTGTPLSLPVRTVVLSVKNQQQMGKSLYLKDDDGKILVFSHLSEAKVQQGDRVEKDKVFALSGNTGSATTGPHLHFEVIATSPQQGYEEMSRSLGGFVGYNHNPKDYLDNAGHWSDEAMEWLKTHEIITKDHDPDSLMTWGEFAVTSRRLAEKILSWSRTP